MKSVTLGQIRKTIDLLDKVSEEQYQEILASGLLSDLLKAKNVGKINRKHFRELCGLSVSMKHSEKDDLEYFLSKIFEVSCEIVYQDWQLSVLDYVDLSGIQLKHMLNKDESLIKYQERLERLKKADGICLGAEMFKILYEDQDLIPEHWKQKINGELPRIIFDGTTLQIYNNERYILCMSWSGSHWHFGYVGIGGDYGRHCLSAILVP